jgi:hypothetical protein
MFWQEHLLNRFVCFKAKLDEFMNDGLNKETIMLKMLLFVVMVTQEVVNGFFGTTITVADSIFSTVYHHVLKDVCVLKSYKTGVEEQVDTSLGFTKHTGMNIR